MNQKEIDDLLRKVISHEARLTKVCKPKTTKIVTVYPSWKQYDVISYCTDCLEEMSKNVLHTIRSKILFFYCERCKLSFQFKTIHKH